MGREYHREYIKRWYKKKRLEYTALLGGKCAECNSTDDLQFDHKDPATKSFNIGRMLTHPTSKVLDELKKCQLLCYTCHKRKHQSKRKVAAKVVKRT